MLDLLLRPSIGTNDRPAFSPVAHRLDGNPAFTKGPAHLVAGLGAGASGTFNPNNATGNSSTMTVSTTATAATGTFPLTITGTSGSPTHSTWATLVVNAGPG